ncbi:conjugal transfer protein TraG N-terminal domain-containing protein (plasmid) [Vibrio sp. SS-MA-C1-2]|uniref:conjugal transfer protein TraG N-terminal domain-containing protein n=1 Tax=Vibrio sp. SS-MA-C1-2 TaxID=2908646 RepID=UPI001F1F3CC1|nr:conjugal transfer protein TraG N-terminal domain-containing protein [Vibrio sp. SS-MA-C1-2]UJF20212.1 conjugal transfer protein TraG N-terminal domain-containing protein [Vibrio sp. SS-MA-C1-2]
MEWTIYTLGNFDFTSRIFRAVQMAFDPSTGDFGNANYVLGLGLLLAVLAGALKGIFEKGMPDFGMVIKGYALWLLLFVPRVDVVLEQPTTGNVSFYPDMPIGLAVAGNVSTSIPNAFREIVENLFVLPNSGSSHVNALRALVKTEKAGQGDGSKRTLDTNLGDTDFSTSFVNYMNDCYYEDIRTSAPNTEANPAELYSALDSWAALEITSNAWYTDVKLGTATDGVWKRESCDEAYRLIGTYFTSPHSDFHQMIQANLIRLKTSEVEVKNALVQLGNSSEDALDLATNQFIQYHLYKSANSLPSDDPLRAYLADYQEFQAKNSRIYEQAGAKAMWMEMAPALISIFEGFVWFCAPLISFFVLFGENGIKTSLGYFRFLVLVGLYPVVGVLIDFYLDWSIEQYNSNDIVDGSAFTIGGISTFYTEAQSYIANASFMYTFIPLLAYMMLKGGEYAAVSMANRIGGGQVQAGGLSPNIAPNVSGGSYKIGTHTRTMGEDGSWVGTQSGFSGIGMGSISGISGITSGTTSSTQASHSTMKATSSAINQQLSSLAKVSKSWVEGANSGEAGQTSLSKGQQYIAQVAHQLSKNTGKSYEEAYSTVVNAGVRGMSKIPGLPSFNATTGGQLSEADRKSLNKAISNVNSDSTIIKSDFSLQNTADLRKAFSDGRLNDTAYTNMKQSAQQYNEAKQRIALNSATEQSSNGVNLKFDSNLSAAIGTNNRFAAWYKNLKAEEFGGKDTDKYKEFEQKYLTTLKALNGHEGMTAAQMYIQDVNERQRNIGTMDNKEDRAAAMNKLGGEFREIGTKFGSDHNLVKLGGSLEQMATNLNAQKIDQPKLDQDPFEKDRKNIEQDVRNGGSQVKGSVDHALNGKTVTSVNNQNQAELKTQDEENKNKAEQQGEQQTQEFNQSDAAKRILQTIGSGPQMGEYGMPKAALENATTFINNTQKSLSTTDLENDTSAEPTLSPYSKQVPAVMGLVTDKLNANNVLKNENNPLLTSNSKEATALATTVALSMPGANGEPSILERAINNNIVSDFDKKVGAEMINNSKEIYQQAQDNPKLMAMATAIRDGKITPESAANYYSAREGGFESNTNNPNFFNNAYAGAQIVGDEKLQGRLAPMIGQHAALKDNPTTQLQTGTSYSTFTPDNTAATSIYHEQKNDSKFVDNAITEGQSSFNKENEAEQIKRQTVVTDSLKENGTLSSQQHDLFTQAQVPNAQLSKEQWQTVNGIANQNGIQLTPYQQKRVNLSSAGELPSSFTNNSTLSPVAPQSNDGFKFSTLLGNNPAPTGVATEPNKADGGQSPTRTTGVTPTPQPESVAPTGNASEPKNTDGSQSPTQTTGVTPTPQPESIAPTGNASEPKNTDGGQSPTQTTGVTPTPQPESIAPTGNASAPKNTDGGQSPTQTTGVTPTPQPESIAPTGNASEPKNTDGGQSPTQTTGVTPTPQPESVAPNGNASEPKNTDGGQSPTQTTGVTPTPQPESIAPTGNASAPKNTDGGQSPTQTTGVTPTPQPESIAPTGNASEPKNTDGGQSPTQTTGVTPTPQPESVAPNGNASEPKNTDGGQSPTQTTGVTPTPQPESIAPTGNASEPKNTDGGQSPTQTTGVTPTPQPESIAPTGNAFEPKNTDGGQSPTQTTGVTPTPQPESIAPTGNASESKNTDGGQSPTQTTGVTPTPQPESIAPTGNASEPKNTDGGQSPTQTTGVTPTPQPESVAPNGNVESAQPANTTEQNIDSVSNPISISQNSSELVNQEQTRQLEQAKNGGMDNQTAQLFEMTQNAGVANLTNNEWKELGDAALSNNIQLNSYQQSEVDRVNQDVKYEVPTELSAVDAMISGPNAMDGSLDVFSTEGDRADLHWDGTASPLDIDSDVLKK